MSLYKDITQNFGLACNKCWQVGLASQFPNLNYKDLVYEAAQAGRSDHVEIFERILACLIDNSKYDNDNERDWKKLKQDAKIVHAIIRKSVNGMDEWITGEHTNDYFATIDRKTINIIISYLITVVTGKPNGPSSYSRNTYLCGTLYCCDLDEMYCGYERQAKIMPSTITIDNNHIICMWQRFGKYYVRKCNSLTHVTINRGNIVKNTYTNVVLANHVMISPSHNRLSWRDEAGLSFCFCHDESMQQYIGYFETIHEANRCDLIDRKYPEEQPSHLLEYITGQMHELLDIYTPKAKSRTNKHR